MGMFKDLHKLDLAEQADPGSGQPGISRRATKPPHRPSAPRPAPDTVPAASSPHLPPHVESPATLPAGPPPPPAALLAQEPLQPHQDIMPTAVTHGDAQPGADDELDLSQMPYRKFTCVLTPAEQRALDLLKLDLSD